MTILEIYKEKNKDVEWFQKHFSLGKNMAGKFFNYGNTNFRTTLSFRDQFTKFLILDGVQRSDWPLNESHGQENDKHRVVNMLHSKFFRINPDGTSYSTTLKGKYYKKFLEVNTLSEDAGWVINFLFLINGYFSDRKNYITSRVGEDLLGYFSTVPGLTTEVLLEKVQKIIKIGNLTDLLAEDIFYLHSFYDDSDFLIAYLRSDDGEKKELTDYIIKNIETKTFDCCISRKYKPSGNFNFSMFEDEIKTFVAAIFF